MSVALLSSWVAMGLYGSRQMSKSVRCYSLIFIPEWEKETWIYEDKSSRKKNREKIERACRGAN